VRFFCSIVVAACVALVAIRAPHLRRAQPTATLSTPTAHYHHARTHRSPAALAAPVLLPSRDVAIVDPLIVDPGRAIDRDQVISVARGPPVA
jgi:hypothetical protein